MGGLPPHTLPKPADLGFDYFAAQNASFMALLEHEKVAKQWYFPRSLNGTLPKELDHIRDENGHIQVRAAQCLSDALARITPPTAGYLMGEDFGRRSGANFDQLWAGPNSI